MKKLHLFELNILAKISLFRNSFLNEIFIFANFFDTNLFYLFLIPIIWFFKSQKWGLRVIFILLLSFLLNHLCKELFHQFRPYFYEPSLGLLTVKGFSFPSGAAQNSILLSFILIKIIKNKKIAYPLAIFYTLFVSFSRIYLGVHFISDIIGGWILGLFLILILYKIFPKTENFLSKQKPISLLILSFIFGSIFFLFPTYLSYIATYIYGVSLGYFLYITKFSYLEDKKYLLIEKLYLLILSFLGLFLIHFIFKFNIYIQTFLAGIWFIIGTYLTYNSIKIFLKKSN